MKSVFTNEFDQILIKFFDQIKNDHTEKQLGELQFFVSLWSTSNDSVKPVRALMERVISPDCDINIVTNSDSQCRDGQTFCMIKGKLSLKKSFCWEAAKRGSVRTLLWIVWIAILWLSLAISEHSIYSNPISIYSYRNRSQDSRIDLESITYCNCFSSLDITRYHSISPTRYHPALYSVASVKRSVLGIAYPQLLLFRFWIQILLLTFFKSFIVHWIVTCFWETVAQSISKRIPFHPLRASSPDYWFLNEFSTEPVLNDSILCSSSGYSKSSLQLNETASNDFKGRTLFKKRSLRNAFLFKLPKTFLTETFSAFLEPFMNAVKTFQWKQNNIWTWNIF